MPMTSDDRTKYKDLYATTSRKYLEKIDTIISKLLEDQYTDERMGELLLAAHSLAGQSMVIGYYQIGEYASLIQKVAEENRRLDKSILQDMHKGIQRIADSLEEIEKNDKEINLEEEIHSLRELTGIKK